MEIVFEWHTTKISDDKKKEVEDELASKIRNHYGQIIKTPASKLIVSLFDEKPGYLLTGAAVSVKGETVEEVIKNISYDPGIHLEFIPN
ncbi:MAG: hypothetical protein ABIJ59_01615 [Pseudomonadota bacterium]